MYITIFALETLVSVILKKICIIFSYIGIIISVSVILKKIKFIVIPIYLHSCNIPKGHSSNSSKISDYVNVVEITATQHYTRIVKNRFSEQKMLENDGMETASTEVKSIWRRNDIEKSTWRTHRHFVDSESRIHVASMS